LLLATQNSPVQDQLTKKRDTKKKRHKERHSHREREREREQPPTIKARKKWRRRDVQGAREEAKQASQAKGVGRGSSSSVSSNRGRRTQTNRQQQQQQQCVCVLFFRSILCYSQNGDHPQEDLTTFGY